MIKPENVRPRRALPRVIEQQMAALERSCDDAIRAADRDENWPACVLGALVQASEEAVARMAERYRLHGWKVNTRPDDRSMHMEIDRP